MKSKNLSRRDMLKIMGGSSAAFALAACAPSDGPAAGGGDAAPDGEKVSMSIATFAAELHDWQREFAKRWAEENADSVDLQIEEVVYNEMSKLQLARSASGTLWDLTFSGIKWFPFSASKGMFLGLNDFMENRPDAALDDFVPTAILGGYLDGQLYGLPYEIHPGNPALVAINTDMLGDAGMEMPTDDWTIEEYATMAAELSDPDNNVYGTNYLPGNYYDFESLIRAYDSHIFDGTNDNFTFNENEANREAAQWIVNLRTELNAAPNRADTGTEGLDFVSGAMATQVTGSYSVNGWTQQIGDKFNHDWVLFPRGPEGGRGYSAFTSNYSVASSTADPDKAVDLLIYLSSTEAGTWSALEQGTGQPNARISVWENEDLLGKLHPIFSRVLAMYNDDSIEGPFPMPSNLRFQELQDNWANTSPDLFYGDLSYEEGMQAVQDACQEIMELPRA